jgi:ABC-type sugar transport system substrate-binding protein
MIQGGKAAATWNLHPEAIAHTLAWAAERAVCGVKMPSSIYVPVTRVDKANATKWVPWAKLPSLPFRVKLRHGGGKTFVRLGSNP